MDERPRKCLTVWWDPATNEIELDDMGHGLSIFDKAGLLACALELAGAGLPSLEFVAEDSTED